MRLDDLDPSKNARDLGTGRGGGGGAGLGGLLSLLPMLLGRKMGIGTVVIIAIVGYFMFSGGGLGLSSGTPDNAGDAQVYDTQAEIEAGRVLTSTEQTWSVLFQQSGERYQPAGLSFYDRGAQSGCGAAQSAMGPFYCPTDQNVYLDTAFFDEMAQRMGAEGDFARNYVIAHEVGHHIQNLLGRLDQVRGAQARASQSEGNALQVRVELQADCYAGVWAGRNRDRMEPGDMEEGLRAAHQIGDDTLMRNAGQRPVEDMFTHGTSEQRMTWLRRGVETGDPAQCDTFNASI